MRPWVWVVVLAACRGEGPVDDARSEGLRPAVLPAAVQARVVDAAASAAFDRGPGLVLLLHPLHLPPGSGYEGGAPVPDSLTGALRAAGVVTGVCDPARESEQRAPRCDALRSGYVIRASEVFQGTGDTVRLFLASEIFAATNGPGQQPFLFEMAYKLIPRGDSRWRVVAEGRVRGSKQ
jgi:hypothetical protein